MRKTLPLLTLAVLLLAGCAREATPEQRARALIAKMTLEEKASLMEHSSAPVEALGIPAYNWWNEVLHGVARAGTATVFPQAIGLAAIFDEEMHEEIATVIAE
jgi:beta-glucosidase